MMCCGRMDVNRGQKWSSKSNHVRQLTAKEKSSLTIKQLNLRGNVGLELGGVLIKAVA